MHTEVDISVYKSVGIVQGKDKMQLENEDMNFVYSTYVQKWIIQG